MSAIDRNDEAVVIIGSGAGGGTLAYELTARGIPVVVLEAGPYLHNEDYTNDEWGAFTMMAWTDPRTDSGPWRVSRDFPALPAWTVKAVGGTTTHWAGVTPRIKAHEFKARTAYGRLDGAHLLDWPLARAEMDPWYDKAEIALGSSHRHGRPPLPANNNYKVFAEGAKRVGYTHYATGPYATNAEDYDGRPGSVQDGFNFQGDKNKSKWSTLVRELPRAEATGKLDLRPNCHAAQITHDAHGRVDAVLYIDSDGVLQRQRARVVAVACNAIETARLLLLSASPRFPDGLANSSGQVGRNYMAHLTGTVYGAFEKPVHMYRGETMAGLITDESRHDAGRGFAGGFYFETIALGPAFLAKFLDPGAWGRDFTSFMEQYRNLAAVWICGEDMPQESNRVMLDPSITDQHGLPVAHVRYGDHPNDATMREYAYQRASAMFEAVGATRVYRTPPYPSTHNMGTTRMSARPEDGVVNKWGQAHDVPNLFVSDGSVFTTSAAANPTLTIVALAIRQADYIAGQLSAGAL